MTKPRARLLIAATMIALAGACAGSDDQIVTAPSAAGAGSSPSTAATVSLPSTTESELQIEGAVTVPSLAPEQPGAQPLRWEVETTAGTRYTMDGLAGDAVTVTITDALGGHFGYIVGGMGGLGTDDDLSGQLVDVFELSTLEVFVDPNVDFTQLTGGAPPPGMLEPAPDDYLTWMSGRPGVTAGPITETEFAGYPARAMTYEVGEVEGAIPCYDDDPRGCLAGITNSHDGVGYVDYEGTTMTVYQLELLGLSFVVAVSDLPGAADLAATITFAEAAPPAGVGDAVALDRTGELSETSRYFWLDSSYGTYTFAGVPGVTVSPMTQTGASWLELTDDRFSCMSISDGAVATMVAPSAAGWDADGPVGADLIDRIVANEQLDVVAGPTPVTVGGVEATAVEVARTLSPDPALIIGEGMLIWPDEVTRVVALPRPGGGAPDIVMVEIDSPCEAVYDSIEVVPAG